MNAFASYGEAKAPERPRSKPKQEKAPSALDLKLQERQRLNRHYRLWRRAHNREVLGMEPRLVGFMRYLKTVQPRDSDDLLEAVRDSWLPGSAQEVRIFALRMIEARCDKLNRSMGNDALDDPMPPESSVYIEARDMLHAGGRA
jgi:hypothetical protein